MTLYTASNGRRITAESIVRAWIRANPAKARAMLEGPPPSAFPQDFGVEVEEGEGGAVRVYPA